MKYAEYEASRTNDDLLLSWTIGLMSVILLIYFGILIGMNWRTP